MWQIKGADLKEHHFAINCNKEHFHMFCKTITMGKDLDFEIILEEKCNHI